MSDGTRSYTSTAKFVSAILAIDMALSVIIGFMLSAGGYKLASTGQSSIHFIPDFLLPYKIPFDDYFVRQRSLFSDQCLFAAAVIATLPLLAFLPLIRFVRRRVDEDVETRTQRTKSIRNLWVVLIIMLFGRYLLLYKYFSPDMLVTATHNHVLFIGPLAYIGCTSGAAVLLIALFALYFTNPSDFYIDST